MKSGAVAPRVKVLADGDGVESHVGMGMLRELADQTGLSAQVTAALADSCRGPWVHAQGAVFADLAAAVADGADCIDRIGQLCQDRARFWCGGLDHDDVAAGRSAHRRRGATRNPGRGAAARTGGPGGRSRPCR